MRGYKLHPLTQLRFFGLSSDVTADDDITTCSMIRDEVGEDMCLMLDAAWAYSYAEALRVGFALEELDCHWYEDPLAADDLYGYRALKDKLCITLVATELTEGSLWGMPSWITELATDALRRDAFLKGGLTPLMKIAHLAEAFHLNCEVHDGFSSPGNVACLHAALAMPNTEMFEVIAINAPNNYGVDHLNYGLVEPFDADRNVMAPTRPGFGHTIDWDLFNSSITGELQ